MLAAACARCRLRAHTICCLIAARVSARSASDRSSAGRAAGDGGAFVNQTPSSLRRVLLEQLERFLRVEVSSAIVLFCATIVALLWANSPWHGGYESLQHLRSLVNDGLMTVFFLVVGLEIRREMDLGTLSSARVAAVPLVAALGGMLVPALIFLVVADSSLRRGWAIPTATDIAFAVGALTLLGKRVAAPARGFLLALAVIDDIGAILVIAFFYSSGIDVLGLVIATAGVGALLAFRRFCAPAAILGSVIWYGFYRAGVNPTLAGVIVGLVMPASDGRLEETLHPWVAYGIMPLFALVNGGVSIGSFSFNGTLMAAIGLALVLGKPLGITLFTWLATRSGIGVLAPSLDRRGVLLVGSLGGIGFTMSLFLATLAFSDPRLLAAAKGAVLLGSTAAAATAFVLKALQGPM